MLPSGNASGKKIQKRVSLSMTCFGNNLNDEDEPRCVTPTNIVAASVTPKMSRSVLGYSLTPKGTSSFALTVGNVVNVQSQQQQQPQQQKYEEDVLALKQTIDKLRRDSTVEVLQLNAAARQQEGLHKDYKEKVDSGQDIFHISGSVVCFISSLQFHFCRQGLKTQRHGRKNQYFRCNERSVS